MKGLQMHGVRSRPSLIRFVLPAPPRLASSASSNMPLSRRPSWVDNRKAYASLPSSPVAAAATPLPLKDTTQPSTEIPFSLWDYLREEILATDFDSHQEIKWERVSNFLQVPFAIEKVSPRCYSQKFHSPQTR